MSEGLISIIMPVYGVERYIAQAIRSVQSQTYSNWELIVVNDGTKDRSREIAADFAVADKRIKIVDKENGGLSDARNVGLKHVTGEYVNFFDSDDWLEPDFLQVMKDTLDSRNLDLAICGYYVDTIDTAGKIINRIERKDLESRLESPADYLNRMGGYVNFAWNKLYRTRFLKDHQLYFEKGLWAVEDCEFMSRVFSLEPRFCFISYAGYHYLQRKEITLSKKFDKQIIGFISRKIGWYTPIMKALGAEDATINIINARAQAANIVYLIKQIVRGTNNRADIKNCLESMESNDRLNPKLISVSNVMSLKDKLLVLIASRRMSVVLNAMRKFI